MQLIELHSKSRGLVRCAIAFQNDQIFPNNKTGVCVCGGGIYP